MIELKAFRVDRKAKAEHTYIIEAGDGAPMAKETRIAPAGTGLLDYLSASRNGLSRFSLDRLQEVEGYLGRCIGQPARYAPGQLQKLFNALDFWRPDAIGFLDLAAPKDGRYEVLSTGDIPDHAEEIFFAPTDVDEAMLSLSFLVRERIPVKRCACCGRFFVPLARNDAIYCDRPAPLDPAKTCKEYGSKVLWYRNIQADALSRLDRSVYCSRQMLAKRHPEDPVYAEAFTAFKARRAAWRKELAAGRGSPEEYEAWLRAVKSASGSAGFLEAANSKEAMTC